MKYVSITLFSARAGRRKHYNGSGKAKLESSGRKFRALGPRRSDREGTSG